MIAVRFLLVWRSATDSDEYVAHGRLCEVPAILCLRVQMSRVISLGVEFVSACHSRSRFRGVASITAAVLVMMLLWGCTSSREIEPASERVSSGWSAPAALAPVADFDTYIVNVTEELRTHRLPFDPSMTDRELAMVAPLRLLPAPGCKFETPRGIAILIHGLADSAFAMHDFANSLSRHCFEARVLLLPGHGTRAADLMVVDHNDWLSHVEAAIQQARRESQFVVVAGFSLGAAIALTVAVESPGSVDAVIGISPAYRIRSSTLARQARWIAAFRPWLNPGPRAEFARYGALPTRGLASTIALLDIMDTRVRSRGELQTPWFVVQSEDDEVIDVAGNRQLFVTYAGDPRSVLVNYFSDQPRESSGSRVIWLPAADDQLRVVGLSHLALHISPDNPHYGVFGTYRNCGRPPFRHEDDVRSCLQAERVWYGVGGQKPPVGEAGARATFNPHYPDLERRIGKFLDGIDGRYNASVVSHRGNSQ